MPVSPRLPGDRGVEVAELQTLLWGRFCSLATLTAMDGRSKCGDLQANRGAVLEAF